MEHPECASGSGRQGRHPVMGLQQSVSDDRFARGRPPEQFGYRGRDWETLINAGLDCFKSDNRPSVVPVREDVVYGGEVRTRR